MMTLSGVVNPQTENIYYYNWFIVAYNPHAPGIEEPMGQSSLQDLKYWMLIVANAFQGYEAGNNFKR